MGCVSLFLSIPSSSSGLLNPTALASFLLFLASATLPENPSQENPWVLHHTLSPL